LMIRTGLTGQFAEPDCAKAGAATPVANSPMAMARCRRFMFTLSFLIKPLVSDVFVVRSSATPAEATPVSLS